METQTYAVEYKVQSNHWWFVGRRSLFARIINKYNLNSAADILDIGVSTGTNLKMLSEMGFNNFVGLDLSQEAIRFCQQLGFDCVKQGNICEMPFADNSMDLILATDIIEHVDDDVAAIAEIKRVLRPGGKALITVPTFKLLWGPQDELAHHKRRYRMHKLVKKLESSGLTIREKFYFNYLLFLPIFIARKILNLLPIKLDSENSVNTKLLNKILTRIFSFDIKTAPKISPPFGVSALIVVEK